MHSVFVCIHVCVLYWCEMCVLWVYLCIHEYMCVFRMCLYVLHVCLYVCLYVCVCEWSVVCVYICMSVW